MPTFAPAQLNTNAATFPGYLLYPNYEIVVASSRVPYPVSPDSSIVKNNVIWYDDTDTQQSYAYYPEWLRFTDYTGDPQEEWLEQQRGTTYFQTSDNSEPGSNAQGTSQQSVRMLMPNNLFRMKWTGVPLRYVLSQNSYLSRFRGRINQNAWNGPLGPDINQPLGASFPAGTAGVFATGQLLYVGFKYTSYLPVLPVTFSLFGSFIDYSRLCDIDLFFLDTTRTVTLPPTQPSAPTSPAGRNIVVNGWNALPYLPLRKFYYGYNSDLAGHKNPLFYSFPLELLFSDPDTPGAYSGNG